VADFIEDVNGDLRVPAYSWDRAATIRERFRARLRNEVSGRIRLLPGSALRELLAGAERRALTAVEKAVDPRTGLPAHVLRQSAAGFRRWER